MKHTPGPWTFDKDDLGIWINSPAYPQPIAKMGKSTVFPTEANARLIAAAPDLLEAAQAAMNCIGELPPTQARVETAQMLSAAIRKATGES
jgi:hypothetical protein